MPSIKINPLSVNAPISYLLAIIGGLLSLFLGLSVLIGWYTHSVALIQVSSAFVPMQFNTAAGFLLSGLGVLAVSRNLNGIGTSCGLAVIFIGLFTLIEYIFEINLSIDQVLMKHYITVQTSHPGRMAPNTALCFLLSGITLVVLGTKAGTWNASMFAGTLASITFGLSFIAITGYAFNFEATYGWGSLTRMAVHTAIGFMVLGAAFIGIAWHQSSQNLLRYPSWIPITVGVGFLSIIVSIWQAQNVQLDMLARGNIILEGHIFTNNVLLIVGAGLAIVLSLATYFAQTARTSERKGKVANSRLKTEIIERQQAQEERDKLLHDRGERIKELLCMYGLTELIRTHDSLEQIFENAVLLIPSGWQYPKITRARLCFDDQEYISEPFEETEWKQSADIVAAGKRRGSIEVFYLEECPKFDEGPFLTEERDLIDSLALSLSLAIEYTESDKNREVAMSQLRQSQKMDAIGQLTGGIAHDFNNVLAIILGNVELLQFQASGDSKTRKRLNAIEKSAQRAANLTRQLLGFSRSEIEKKTNTNINFLIEGMEKLIFSSVTPQVDMDFILAEELWLTEIDIGDFEDALLNLILNARDAVNNSGYLVVETANCTLDEAYCAMNPNASPGEYVQLAISDDGVGISLERQERIFEPFYTTKPKDKGTGLGLSMVYGFVKRSGGYIKVYSECGIGTTIRLYFPRSEGDIPSKEITIAQSSYLSQGNETILVVDDEEDLRELAQESLQELGYKILVANNGSQALERLSEDPGIDLLFSDVVMPGGINGYELAEKATKAYPKLKVLLTSGYTSRVLSVNGQSRFNANLLNKPYTQSELAHRVRVHLGGLKVDNVANDDIVKSTQSVITPVEWTKDLSLNIDEMDDDHRVLLGILNHSQLAAANGDNDQCKNLLDQAQAFALKHLRREELMMAACGYSGLNRHHQVHQFMLKQINSMQQQLDKGELWIGELANFLANWWLDHIQTMDRAYSSYCQGKEELIEQALLQADAE